MQPGQPSRTALGAASHRAAHQVLDRGRIFEDPLALRILGAHAEAAIASEEDGPFRRGLRLFIAVRSRFAEDAVADAVGRGLKQLVILGAGLDTYAYRTPFGERLRIFEVDHPATQEWKRDQLREAGIEVPPWVTFAPVDFERQALPDGLAQAGFTRAQPAFFTWLGVVPYLTESAVYATLGFIGHLPARAHVVFDYANPPAPHDEHAAMREALAARAASVGEPFESQFEAEDLRARLTALGFDEIEDLGPAEIRRRFFPQRAGSLPDRGGHVIHAAKAPSAVDNDATLA